MERGLAYHKYGQGLSPRMDAIYGLSLLLVLLSALREFSPGTSVLPAPQIPTYHKFNLYGKVSPNL